jgi:hypothetical protein
VVAAHRSLERARLFHHVLRHAVEPLLLSRYTAPAFSLETTLPE